MKAKFTVTRHGCLIFDVEMSWFSLSISSLSTIGIFELVVNTKPCQIVVMLGD